MELKELVSFSELNGYTITLTENRDDVIIKDREGSILEHSLIEKVSPNSACIRDIKIVSNNKTIMCKLRKNLPRMYLFLNVEKGIITTHDAVNILETIKNKEHNKQRQYDISVNSKWVITDNTSAILMLNDKIGVEKFSEDSYIIVDKDIKAQLVAGNTIIIVSYRAMF
jgi:hypothetical protein